MAAGTTERVIETEDRAIGSKSAINGTGAIVRNRSEQGSGTGCTGQQHDCHAQRTTPALEANDSPCQRNSFELESARLSVRAEHVFVPAKRTFKSADHAYVLADRS